MVSEDSLPVPALPTSATAPTILAAPAIACSILIGGFLSTTASHKHRKHLLSFPAGCSGSRSGALCGVAGGCCDEQLRGPGGISAGCRWLVAAAAVQRPLLLLGTAAAYNPLHA